MTTYVTSSGDNIGSFPFVATPIQGYVGTSYSYPVGNYNVEYQRSNNGTAMTDTLQNPAAASAENPSLPNGAHIIITNTDATATITVTATAPATINGASTYVIAAGSSVTFKTNSVNYFVDKTSASPAPLIQTGTSYTYTSGNNGQTVIRSNSGTNMTDTLPVATSLPANYVLWIMNADGTAHITLTPTTSTINGNSSLTIDAGAATRIVINGSNYQATTPT